MIHISASLLAADYTRLGGEVQRAEQGGADSFHFDLMDGHYVRNLALAPDHLTALRPYTSLPFYAHLELSNPDEVLSRFESFPADMIVVQWNTLTHPHKIFKDIRLRNAKVGLGLTPDDDIGNVARFFPDLDLLLLLGVYPGFGGQPMQPGTLEKVRTARGIANNLNSSIAIAVDGGVKPDNAVSLVEAGADVLIMGTALFQVRDIKQTISGIREAIARSPRH
ncbi:MAG: ribulose-phosphate 3-epimerase [Anaerolineaceae bacterium]|nr:MAG: ribulose-phosphate 3-epimerase [Anaerolineaceae bacterium]